MRSEKSFKSLRTLFLAVATIALLSIPLAAASQTTSGPAPDENQLRLAKQVRHELVMLPWYSVFDNLQFSLEGDHTVVLSGQTIRPTIKSGAENVVKRVEGVTQVINNIEVLPLSPFDYRIRRAEFRAIYSQPSLSRYALQAGVGPGFFGLGSTTLSGVNLPIHIIVKNGHVTLVGVVASTMDKTVAGIAANAVPNVFSVVNDLQVEGQRG
jgi:hyperosmotically inducible protein